MTIITKDIQIYLDLDWFLVDKNDNIVHFASGGGQIPDSIAVSEENYKLCYDFFKNLPVKYDNYVVNPSLGKFRLFSNELQKERYLEVFVEFAKKGIISFDKTNLGDFNNLDYHCVATPVINMKLNELPANIKAIINRTRYSGDINELYSISSLLL